MSREHPAKETFRQKKNPPDAAVSWKHLSFKSFQRMDFVGFFPPFAFDSLGGRRGAGGGAACRITGLCGWPDLSLNPDSICSLCDRGWFPNASEPRFSHLLTGDKNACPTGWVENETPVPSV